MPLNNFGIVTYKDGPKGSLARCAQPDISGFIDLYSFGYKVIYKLNEDTADVIDELTQQLITDYYPPIFEIPSKDKILATARKVQSLLNYGNNVVIHCSHGRDRTGLIVGAYRILFEEWTFDQVEKERQLYGAKGLIDNIADSKIIEFLKQLKS